MPNTDPVNYEIHISDVMAALGGIHDILDKYGFDRKIHHLVQLRASQINGCAFCIRMHTKEARQDNETDERLDRLSAWNDVDDFNEREKSALAWTEALTILSSGEDLGALRAEMRKHFSEAEIGILTTTIAMINLWNRIQISRH